MYKFRIGRLLVFNTQGFYRMPEIGECFRVGQYVGKCLLNIHGTSIMWSGVK